MCERAASLRQMFLELKEEEIFDKLDRTVELLGPSQSFTGF